MLCLAQQMSGVDAGYFSYTLVVSTSDSSPHFHAFLLIGTTLKFQTLKSLTMLLDLFYLQLVNTHR